MNQDKPKRDMSHLKNVFTAEEKKFIRDHAPLPEWSDTKIAAHLGRSVIGVAMQRKKMGIHKVRGGFAIDVDSKSLNPELINKANLSDEEKFNLWRNAFKRSKKYKQFEKELIKSDLELFTDKWCEYHMQFDDLKPTEESTIEQLITLELRISDNRKSYKESQVHEEQLRELLNGRSEKDLDLQNEQDRFIFELISSNNRIRLELTKELRELQSKHEALTRALNATREQRESREKIGGDTFISLVKTLTDRERRKKIGQYNEWMRIAREKELAELKKPHKFVDGQIEPVILDGQDYKKDITNEK
jgi:hypothetical protein